MIQEIAPHIFNNKYICVTEISPEDYVLYFRDNMLMLKKTDDEPDIPERKDLSGLKEPGEAIYLFSLNERNCFLIKEYQHPDPDTFVFEEINFFRTLKKKEVAWISIVGNQLMNWYSLNQYCGRCGHKTKLMTHERAITCPHCHTTVYPKISPAIIVAITCGDKILLAQGRNFRSSFYSLVAGYADIGESLEDAVKREVMEEVGIEVKNISYYKSQPWPFSGSMMIGYWAEADDSQPIHIDENEIVDAQWFTRGNLPNHPTSISIAGEMIGLFEGKF